MSKQKRKAYACDIKLKIFQVREAEGPKVRSGQDFYNFLQDSINMDREAFFVVTLNQQHEIIDKYLVALGTLTASLVHGREVFKPAIFDGAAAIAIAHNHPSGDPTPSPEDKAITKRLAEIAKMLGIRLLDHVIVGRGRYMSFVDEGLL